MVRASKGIVIFATVWLVASAAAQAPLTSAFTYQGNLQDNGVPANGSFDLQFKLYNSLNAQVGSTICSDNVNVVDGLFTVQLDFGVTVFNGEARALEVGVRPGGTVGNCAAGAYTTLAAKQALTATPYALQTRGIFTNSALNVGIGTTAPTAKLDVNAAGGAAIIGRTAAGATSIYGVNGAAAAYPFSNTAGVRGDGTGNSEAGVLGVAANYIAVEGYTSTGIAAVYGHSDSADGTALYGVASGANSMGLFATGPTAAMLLGPVSIQGTLSKSAGSFKIDHPLDPANQYLYHSFVESPDMKNVYDGTVTTNADGLATVEMPNWFQALNKDFRYQLTVMGQFAQAIVSEELRDNRFVIRTDKPNVKVSWQVTGIRQDAYANANRIPIEQEKAVEDRGKYLHPELFGAAADCRIGPAIPRTPEQSPALHDLPAAPVQLRVTETNAAALPRN